MIESFYRLGRALAKVEGMDDYFSPWQNPFPRGDRDKCKVLFFPIDSGKVGPYLLEPFKGQTHLKRYLYRKASGSNGAPLVPTAYFYPSNKKEEHRQNIKKLMGRLKRAIPDEPGVYFSSKEERLCGLEQIEQQLLAFQGETNNRYLLTFKVNDKWLGEIPENIALFEKEAYGKYCDKSSARDKICSLTYEKSEEVWGTIDTLGFTVNDPPFARSGFSEANAYKMFPVSPQAVIYLEGAREFAMEKLRRNFHGLEYIIIPHFLRDNDLLISQTLKYIEKREEETSEIKDLSKSILNYESVLKILAEDVEEVREGVFYDILFFQKNQAQFAIKLHLADMLPSRFAQIFSAKEIIEKKYTVINRIESKNKEPLDFYITFSRIQKYFSKKRESKSEVIFQPLFYKVVEAVFYGQPLDETTILKAFLQQIQHDFKRRNESSLQYLYTLKESWALWYFFALLGLFPKIKITDMDTSPVPRTLPEFEKTHSHFFDEPYKKAAFYMGCLVSLLTSAQWEKLKSEPFLERLNGLSFDDSDLRKLYPVLLDKIRQYEDIEKYQRTYVQDLKAAIVPILMEPTELGRTEISFAFTAGMVMQKEFTQYRINQSKAAKADS